MKRSSDRILVTHQGTLPRPDDLQHMIGWAKLQALVEGAQLAPKRLWG